MATLQELIDQILAFRDEREWEKFHTPRQLASALAIECGELQETMLWKTDEEVAAMISQPETRQSLEEEIGDVLIYALLLSAQTRIDPEGAVVNKLAKNEIRYPARLAKGNAKKYTEFPEHE